MNSYSFKSKDTEISWERSAIAAQRSNVQYRQKKYLRHRSFAKLPVMSSKTDIVPGSTSFSQSYSATMQTSMSMPMTSHSCFSLPMPSMPKTSCNHHYSVPIRSMPWTSCNQYYSLPQSSMPLYSAQILSMSMAHYSCPIFSIPPASMPKTYSCRLYHDDV